jgi:F420-dependent methylenetetrahydromethanopterin dehydrogenase
MSRPDWDYIKGCFSLTPKERVVVIAAAAVLALGAAVKYWRESRALPEPVAAAESPKK